MKEKEHPLSADHPEKQPQRARMQDDFWDLDSMLPSRMQQDPSHSDILRDTEAVDIVFGEDGVPPADLAADHRIPPMPNITTRAQRAPSRRGQPLPQRGHTPGDVSPQMAMPVCKYHPQDSLVREVAVFRWPDRYHYYERFTEDAKRYFNRAAAECPFVNFFAYMPQYSQMSQDQLRWYLYWRDNVRHGTYLTTDYSYLFLYIYEIINLPERIKPKDGLELLCDLWLAYREAFPRLDRYLGEWVCDYCLIHGLTPPLDRLDALLPTLVGMLTFREFYVRFRASESFPITRQLCDVLSNYKWQNSRYAVGADRALFEEHLYAAVLGALRHAWEEDPDDFTALMGFSEIKQSRNAFAGALCTFACKRRIDVTYLSLSRSYRLRFIISDMFRLAENGIRAHLGIKSRLSVSGIPGQLKEAIRSYFETHLPPPAKPVRKKTEVQSARTGSEGEGQNPLYAALYEPLSVTLSTDAAYRLETESWENTAMLVPQDEQMQDTPAPASAPTPTAENEHRTDSGVQQSPAPASPAVTAEDPLSDDDPYLNFVHHLRPEQFTALKHIICMEWEEYDALCKRLMLLGETMADAINECAVTYTDDTVLDADGAHWKLSDFYANDVTNAVCAREDEPLIL